jgi:hypothetical protein
MFSFCKYWGTWSRVLLVPWSPIDGRGFGFYLEVNLTPIGSYHNSSPHLWQTEVAPIMVRRHFTPPEPGEMKDKLPPMAVTAMYLNVGAEVSRRLIAADLLSEMDLSLVRAKMRGGGILLSECRKVVA